MNHTPIVLLGILAMLTVLTISLPVRLSTIQGAISTADIAGTRVPPVSCAEDEAIWWVDVDQLGCVHFEEVR